ncbi:MAG: hypothetical protein QOD84_2003 [Acidobacteriaceae bacterium]
MQQARRQMSEISSAAMMFGRPARCLARNWLPTHVVARVAGGNRPQTASEIDKLVSRNPTVTLHTTRVFASLSKH